MSRLGIRVSAGVIVVSSLFISGYLLRCGGSQGQAIARSAPAAPPHPATMAPVPPPAAARRALSPVPPSAQTAPPRPDHLAPARREGSTSFRAAAATDQAPAQTPAPPAGEPEDAPRLEVPETTFDFGELYQMQEVSHEFLVRNVGKRTLAISNITASCGCTVVEPSRRELAPGEEAMIKVTFNAGRYRDRVTKHIYVDTNDPVTPRAILTITGVVKMEVEATPTGIYTGRMKVGETLERAVVLRPVEVKSFRVLGVECDHRALTAEVCPVADQPGAYQVRIRFGPVAKPERVNARVTIRTDLPHTKEITIAVFGRVEEAPVAPPAAAAP